MTSRVKEARRQAILTTARRIVSTEGSAALHMKELAGLAGVPRASLYRTYRSKEHVIRDITVAWGIDFARRLQAEKPRGRTRGARIERVFKRLLQEADSDPKLIAAVLESLLSSDVVDDDDALRLGIEALLPDLLRLAVDVDTMPDARRVIDVLLRLLLANLQMMTSGRASLDDALSNMVFAAQRLVGAKYWNHVVPY